MFIEYIYIISALVVVVVFGVLLYLISFIFVQRSLNLEKISIYECGFEPFEHTRSVFNVNFYLIAILFIIFDLEVIFLFPWVLVLVHVGFFGMFTMLLFLCLVGLVYIYEWLIGALDW